MAGPRELLNHVVPGERLVFATRRHVAQIFEPIASAIAGLVVVIWLISRSPDSLSGAYNILWFAWLVLLGRAIVLVALWWTDWFVATTSRLLLTHGIIYKKVAMMPLAKVTDMSYIRSIPGRLLGYGQFVMESAGQDQALREVNFVPNSDELYRQICSEIFHKKVANEPVFPTALNRSVSMRDLASYAPWEVHRASSPFVLADPDAPGRAPARFPVKGRQRSTEELEYRTPTTKLRSVPKPVDDDYDESDD